MGYNIMIVDDSAIVRTVIERALRMSGVALNNVYHAANGQSGLETLEQNVVDLVFADLNMPVMDGVTMIAEMELRGMLQKTSVVVVSTDRSEVRMRELKSHGVREYLNKPFTPESIRDTVERCLSS
jgi:two-component system, chemotaxis family, chemotaxis protein CheY